jgi:acyl-CoA-dependent ceramide synthase
MLMAVHNLYPSLRPYTAPFFQLSYYQPDTGFYVQGWDDIYFVFSSGIGFTAVRAITIDWVFRPIARRSGLKKKASIRFAEQAWMALYYGFFWAYGMVSSIPLMPP